MLEEIYIGLCFGIKNVAKGSVFRGHYSNQFDRNDPQLLALALFMFYQARFVLFTFCKKRMLQLAEPYL